MKFKDIFNRTDILRALLLIGSVAIMMLVAPRTDIQSFSYELNQPWKYPLLTAEYDTPIWKFPKKESIIGVIPIITTGIIYTLSSARYFPSTIFPMVTGAVKIS